MAWNVTSRGSEADSTECGAAEANFYFSRPLNIELRKCDNTIIVSAQTIINAMQIIYMYGWTTMRSTGPGGGDAEAEEILLY